MTWVNPSSEPPREALPSWLAKTHRVVSRRAATRFSLLLLSLLPWAAQATSAPGQSVEGATTFLGLLAERRDLALNHCQVGQDDRHCAGAVDQGARCLRYRNNHCVSTSSGKWMPFPEMQITAAAVPSRCQTRFTHMTHRLVGDNPNVAEDARIEAYGPIHTTYDWSRISDVRTQGRQVSFKHPHPNNSGFQQPSRLTVSSADLAARVAYALEFLRMHCDSTSRTGF